MSGVPSPAVFTLLLSLMSELADTMKRYPVIMAFVAVSGALYCTVMDEAVLELI